MPLSKVPGWTSFLPCLRPWCWGAGPHGARALLGVAVATVPVDAQVAPPPLASAAAPLVFRGVTVIDVRDGRRLPDRTVVIVGNRIQTVAPAAAARAPRGARVVNAEGRYLIPGLWDMHYHIAGQVDIAYPLLLANGTTGIRNPHRVDQNNDKMPDDTIRHWQREVAAGVRVGPRQPQDVWTARHGAQLRTMTPQAIGRDIDSLRAAGIKFLKIFPTTFGRDNITPEIYFAVLAAARRSGLHVVGHPPPRAVTLVQAVDSGQRTIEHLVDLYITHHFQSICEGAAASLTKCAEMARFFRRRNAWITPTLAATIEVAPMPRISPRLPGRSSTSEIPPETLKSLDSAVSAAPGRRAVKALLVMMQRADMPVLTGVDAGMPPQFAVHEELALLVATGLTPLGALRAATLNPAEYLNMADSLGTVAAGKVADLVLLDADPLAAITNTAAIRAVIANGRYYDRAALDRLLVQAEDQIRARP